MSLQDRLHELFLLDQHVRGLRARQDAATRRRDAQQKKLNQLEQQQVELSQQLKQLQAAASSLEHQSNDLEERINSHRESMNSVTSNKEYSALLVEVNTLKLEKSKLEDEALGQLGKVDETREQVASVEEKIASQKQLVENAEREVIEAREEVGEKLSEIQAERDTAAAGIPPATLTAFDRLCTVHDGEALAEIEEQDRKRREYICGGCYTMLPVERVSLVMSKPDELVQCPSCERYLFIKQELKTAIGAK